MTTQEQMNQSVMGTYGRFPVVIDHGAGESCADETGKQYIDFGSGIGTNSLGYCNEAWTEAVCKQVKTMQHTSNLYYTKVQADFAQKLCQTAGYEKVFFCNSGAEANECAIKLARKYSFDKYGKGRHKILTLVNSFHGRTLCTLSATGQDVFHNYFFPFVEGFDYVTANDIADLEAKLDDTVCAVMLEYIQGEGGVNALEQAFVDAVFEKCAAKDVLVIADEVQTGVGRTGTFLAGEQFGHKADVTTLAKGIAGGLPMGACLANEKCAGVLGKGSHGSTFGGNPVCCAGGLAVLNTITADGFLAEVQRKAKLLREKLEKLEGGAFSFVCPGSALNEVKSICGDTEDLVTITLGKRHILFEIGDTQLICRRLEGEFLDYKNAIPRKNPIQITVETKALIESIDRVSVVISDKLKSPVRCLFDHDKVMLSAKTGNGEAKDVCRVIGDGNKLEIGFNNRYLMEALRYAPAEKVKIELNTGVSPAIIVPVEGDENFLYMVLPVRLKSAE